MSGEVKSYRLNEPMTWVEFKTMPDDLKVTYMAGFHPEFYRGYQFAVNLIRNFPKADVAEVRHGRWINAKVSGVDHYRCTECGEYIESVWTANFDYHYCPNCGARMDGGVDGGT